MRDHAGVAKVRGIRACIALDVVTQAFVAERSATHELMTDLAPIAPQGHLHVELGQFVGAVEDVNSFAVRTSVVG